MTETHLTDRIDDCELRIDGYEIKRSDRKGREGGGVAIYFKDNLNIVEMEKYQSENIEAICSQKMLIGTVYRPPDRDDFYTLFPPILEQIWQTRKNLLIIGDLNSDLTPNSMNDKGRRLKTILNNYNLKNMIKDPTRVTETTKSVLDLVIVNDASKVISSGVHDICIADHKLVYLKYTLKRSKSKPKIITVKNYKRLDEKAFKNDIENAPWWVCTTFDDIDDMTWCWSKMYESIVDVHIKKRRAKIRSDSLPWIDSQIRKMMNYRYKLLRNVMEHQGRQTNGTNIGG